MQDAPDIEPCFIYFIACNKEEHDSTIILGIKSASFLPLVSLIMVELRYEGEFISASWSLDKLLLIHLALSIVFLL